MNDNQISELRKAFKSEVKYTRSDNKEWNQMVELGYATKKPGYARGCSVFHITPKGIEKLIELEVLSERELESIF